MQQGRQILLKIKHGRGKIGSDARIAKSTSLFGPAAPRASDPNR